MTANNSNNNTNLYNCYIDGEIIKSVWDGTDLDEIRCNLTRFVNIIPKFQISFICFVLLFLIIIISIFGKIKENYRWFILNQAIWDFIICYNSMCENSVKYGIHQNYENICSFHFTATGYWKSSIKGFLMQLVSANPYASLFLLSFSRFLCLYFTNLYKKLTKNGRIFFLLFSFNFIIIFLHTYSIMDSIRLDTFNQCNRENFRKNMSYICYQNYNQSFYGILVETMIPIFANIVVLKSLIFLLLSILSTLMITAKVLKQAKFQYISNRTQFYMSFRIFVVILIQTFMNIFVFLIELIQDLPIIFSYFGYSYWIATHLRPPSWITGYYGLSDEPMRFTIYQLRILFESIIVLTVMTGYREAIAKALKIIYKILKTRKITSVNQLFVRR